MTSLIKSQIHTSPADLIQFNDKEKYLQVWKFSCPALYDFGENIVWPVPAEQIAWANVWYFIRTQNKG